RDVNACADSTFSGKESYCIGRNANACAGSTFSGKESYCQGERAYACAGSTFSGERSYCLGQYDHSCTGTIIQAGAFCAAVYSGSCDGALYGPDPTGTNQGMGSCQDSYGYGYCPTGVPIMGSWNSTNGSFDITGWKGNCCNPAYMVSGECPAGIAICS
ncbi:MAG: hypothetical protein IJ266_00930, partial [Elusimicrobiaceae bacterium]|nr:hypothetical protein [Elusimicrobiaceae bacterium]